MIASHVRLSQKNVFFVIILPFITIMIGATTSKLIAPPLPLFHTTHIPYDPQLLSLNVIVDAPPPLPII